MGKILAIGATQALIYFSYRFSFVLWRIRNVLNFLIVYFLWSSVYSFKSQVFGYSEEKMLTYVLMIGVMNAVVLSTRTTDIAEAIVNGSIMNYLLKPVSFFTFAITREAVDKIINTTFAILEISVFVYFLKPHIFINTDLSFLPSFLITFLCGITIAFFISLSLSLLAFWTSGTWGPRFIYFILISVLAGTAFPLDILPEKVYQLLLFTPFPYLLYAPLRIYLEGVTSQTVPLVIGSASWAILLYMMTKMLWNKGLREFSFYGK
jgi:ABC-2 type transport system permease protein